MERSLLYTRLYLAKEYSWGVRRGGP